MGRPRKWQLKGEASPLADVIAAEFRMPTPVAQALVLRGVSTPDEVHAYFDPGLSRLGDPFLLPDMERGVVRIWEAIEAGERIVIHGDYDVDGITSTALMVEVLSALGAEVAYFVPHRIHHGYGLSEQTLACCQALNDPQLIITVDCGTGSVEAATAAKAAGVDLIVTDHHEPGGDVADALAVINPKMGDDEELQQLAGVGVAFKLCHALVARGRKEGQAKAKDLDLRDWLHFVAMGTIADMVPLRRENRVLASNGMKALNRKGLIPIDALRQVADVRQQLRSYHVGFVLGPRINAAGRLDDPTEALRLLLSKDAKEAGALARELDAVNRDRQQVEAGMVNEAVAAIESWFDPDSHFVIVADGTDWHPGVVGIVASRLVNRYHRPAIVLGVDGGMAKGSCRSIEGFNLIEHLDQVAELLDQYGGHQMAAGVELQADRVAEFREALNRVAKETLSEADLRPIQRIDTWIELQDVTRELVHWIRRMEPFGLENPRPVWASAGLGVVQGPTVVGTKHLRFRVAAGETEIDAIAFNMAREDFPDTPRIDVAYEAQLNAFRGQENLQMQVKAIRGAEG